MAAERQPGSDRGRPAIDWEAAFVYYASPARPGARSYQAVADQFGVSVRTVERHGRARAAGSSGSRDDRSTRLPATLTRACRERAEKLAELEQADRRVADELRPAAASRQPCKVAPPTSQRLFKLLQQTLARSEARRATTARPARSRRTASVRLPEDRTRRRSLRALPTPAPSTLGLQADHTEHHHDEGGHTSGRAAA